MPFFHRYAGILLGLLATVLVSGCALGLPASEGILFAEPGERVIDGVMSTNTNLLPQQAFDHARARYDGDLDYMAWNFSSTGAIGGGIGERFGLGAWPGLIVALASLDGTVRLTGDTFLTVNASIDGNYEVILQQRLRHRNHQGVGIGLFYRSMIQEIGPFSLDSQRPRFRAGLLGARAVVQLGQAALPRLRPRRSAPPSLHLRGVLGVGYSPTFRAPAAYLGVGLVVRRQMD